MYDLDKKNRTIKIYRPDLIKQYSKVLFDLINYRWTQKLEEFNHSPRISKKVLGTDRERIPRSNLKKFRKYLDLENPNHICFHTGKKIEDNKEHKKILEEHTINSELYFHNLCYF